MSEEVEYMMYFDRETNTSKELVLKEKYDKLQQQLDKAIEYIENEQKREAFHHYLDDEDINKLLDILEGDK